MSSGLESIITDIIVTGFEYWCLLILLSNEKSKSVCRKITWVSIIVGLIVLLSYISTPVLIKVCIIIFYISISGRIIYNCPIIKLFGYSVLFIVSQYMSELVVVQAWNIFNRPIFSLNCIYEDFVLEVCVMIHTVFFITICLLKKVMQKGSLRGRFRGTLQTVISGIPFLFVLFSIHISMPQLYDTYARNFFLVSSIGIFIAFIFNTVFTQRYLLMLERRKEEERSLCELELMNQYYLQKLQSQEKVREIYHDLKNHFLFAEKEELSQEIREKLSMYENFYETGNEFLNVIVADKIRKAKKEGINMECHADFSQGDFMEPLDISTIFGNLLDNAIEAAGEIEIGEKYIFLNIAVKRRMIIIAIKNNMKSFGITESEMQTNKWNKAYHGYGLLNVKKSLKKYNGEIKINTYEKEFMVNVVIPLPSERN